MEFDHHQLTETPLPDGSGNELTVHLTGDTAKDASSFNVFRIWLEENAEEFPNVVCTGHSHTELRFRVTK